ncbi:hypothetical protein JXB41_00075 [Candidatus Woesearchaeota archaeon]|nr:hypothetical protein [Candidatus Woesearchaeota archaeon]
MQEKERTEINLVLIILYLLPIVFFLSLICLVFGFISLKKSIIYLSLYNCLLSILNSLKIIKIYIYKNKNNPMVKKTKIESDILDIKNKVTDIHLNLPDEDEKKRKVNTFFTGILLGIGLSLMVEAGIDFILNYIASNSYKNVIISNNITMSALPLGDRLNYEIQTATLSSQTLTLYFMLIIGILITAFSIILHFHFNKQLLRNRYEYQYKTKKNIDLIGLIREDFAKKKIFPKKKLKIKDTFDYESYSCKIKIYSPFLAWLIGEDYVNWFVITEDKITINSRTSKHNIEVNQCLKKYLNNLSKNKIFSEFKLVKKL